mgnify:FL=1
MEFVNHQDTFSNLPDNWNLHEGADVDIEYYGNNDQISESVGTIGLLQQEYDSNSAADRELYFTSTFGVKITD